MTITQTRLKLAVLLCAFAAALLGSLGGAAPAQAQTGAITQSAQTQSSITIKWSQSALPIYGQNTVVTEQAVQIVKQTAQPDQDKYIEVSPTAGTYTFKGLKAGTRYNVYISYSYVYRSSPGNEYHGTVQGRNFSTLPAQVTKVKQSKWWYYIKSVNFTWKAQSGVDGYIWTVRKASNGKKVASGKTGAWTQSASCSVKNNVVYTVVVQAYTVINDKTYKGPKSKAAYLFTQPMCTTKCKASTGKLTIAWGKIDGVTGYDVYASYKAKKGYKKIKSVGKKTKSVSIKKLKGKKISPKKTYHVYIVAKKKVGKTTYTSGKHYTHTIKGKTVSNAWTF